MSAKITTGFKAFDVDMSCRGHKYEVGKTYQHSGDVALCKAGLHFCSWPLEVLAYYNLIGSRFAEVESTDVRYSDKSKSVAGNITIKKEIGIKDLIKAHIDLVFSFCLTKSKSTNKSVVASSGYAAKVASSGDAAQVASSGYAAQVASSGDAAKVASSGYAAKVASSGDAAKVESTGKRAVIAAIGKGNVVKAEVGSWITLAEFELDEKMQFHVPICVKTELVDGNLIKGGVFYKLVKGKFVEA